ncbi:MAG: hypothetical protein ACRECV_13775 [Xanthobacteraceae bacterium]
MLFAKLPFAKLLFAKLLFAKLLFVQLVFAKPKADRMARIFAGVVLSLTLFASGAAWAADCSPYCDYVHDYGPYDFSYVRPGLFGFPVCDRRGNCAPHLVYTYSGPPRRGITIVIHPRRRIRPVSGGPRE